MKFIKSIDMKTIDEIIESNRMPVDIISDLKLKTIVVPPWSKLEKEYEPKYHPVMTDKAYRDYVTKKGELVKLCRITLGLQKLAVKRMTELIFGVPVKRKYNAKKEDEKKVAKIMEAIFKKNRINSVNVERGRALYASCEFVTIWYSQEQETFYAGEKSNLKIRCKTYSPMKKGTMLYPLFDDYDDMIGMSIQYNREVGREKYTYFETYTDKEHIRWAQSGRVGTWEEELREPIKLGKITGVYGYRDEPIWEDESKNVYEAEWSLSRNGNYLRKNSKPTWVEFTDKQIDKGKEPDNDTTSRNILRYGKDDKAGYQTWEQAIDCLKFHVETIRQNFFVQLQLPDMSSESMKTMPMSADSRKMIFIDGQLKVEDEKGIWLDVFNREVNVVKAFMKKMYPKLSSAIDSLDVEVIITAYQIKDEAEVIKNNSDATGGKQIRSRKTAIRNLGDVDDVDEELAEIEREEALERMSDLQEPTEL